MARNSQTEQDTPITWQRALICLGMGFAGINWLLVGQTSVGMVLLVLVMFCYYDNREGMSNTFYAAVSAVMFAAMGYAAWMQKPAWWLLTVIAAETTAGGWLIWQQWKKGK